MPWEPWLNGDRLILTWMNYHPPPHPTPLFESNFIESKDFFIYMEM
jgi:hypothetical protein